MPGTPSDAAAEWTLDTSRVLRRFHLDLVEVEETHLPADAVDVASFPGRALERAFAVGVAATALGTRLFGGYGAGEGADKAAFNRAKKDADAVSAYALSEAVWHLSRALPENHAVIVSLGEGLMPKAGETPEMGSNPLLGFGRVYARPEVAKAVDRLVHRLINDDGYRWADFWGDLQEARVTLWGAAIDTLENTTRFARGNATGPMAILHLFDQPLRVSRGYEGYVGTLVLPAEAVEQAEKESIYISYRTPRRLVLEALARVLPDIPPERIHVWTLGGRSRRHRLESLWREWRELGVQLVEDGWRFPDGGEVFLESGTYAPVYRVGTFTGEDGLEHLFLCDGYASTAEGIQAASLDPVLGNHTSLCLFSSRFLAAESRERQAMQMDPDSGDFAAELAATLGERLEPVEVENYRASILAARAAEVPLDRTSLTIDDFMPRKRWQVLSLMSAMLPDPYTGSPGVESKGDGLYRVTVRSSVAGRVTEATLTLRLRESLAETRSIFSPLLDRFYAGEDYRSRTVDLTDSGRIRNELQTLCSEAIEHFGDKGLRLRFAEIPDAVLPPDKREFIREVLDWYKRTHPVWFAWLELAD